MPYSQPSLPANLCNVLCPVLLCCVPNILITVLSDQPKLFPLPIAESYKHNSLAQERAMRLSLEQQAALPCTLILTVLDVTVSIAMTYALRNLQLAIFLYVLTLCCFVMQEKAALLPPEPSGNAEGPTVSCLFRMPDGTRASRVFLQSQPASLLFEFADAKGAGGLPFGGYQLIMQFPRRLVDAASVQTKSIAEAGLTSPQEVLLLHRTSLAESVEDMPN